MTEVTANPTHFRLLNALKSIGPYIREMECKEGHYFFDCLAVCDNDKLSPEEREFWGWWVTLEASDSQDEADYVAEFYYGLYDKQGDWQSKALPEEVKEQVLTTQQDFIAKLNKVLEERFSLSCKVI